MDGGFLAIIETEKIPKNCRIPNTYLWLTLENQQLIQIEKMTPSEVEENK